MTNGVREVVCRLLAGLAATALVTLVPLGASAAELRIGLAADVTSVDPHAINISPNNTIARHVFESLAHVDEDARLTPGVAESWRTVDAFTWEFKLRRGVKFHDGSDLTAEDVVFSIDRARKLPNGQFSTFANRHLKAGDAIEVMEPRGRFTLPQSDGAPRTILAIAAGSGITPVISLLKTVLEREPLTHAVLLFGNRGPAGAWLLATRPRRGRPGGA